MSLVTKTLKGAKQVAFLSTLLVLQTEFSNAEGLRHFTSEQSTGDNNVDSENWAPIPHRLALICQGQAFEQFPGIDQHEEQIASIQECYAEVESKIQAKKEKRKLKKKNKKKQNKSRGM